MDLNFLWPCFGVLPLHIINVFVWITRSEGVGSKKASLLKTKSTESCKRIHFLVEYSRIVYSPPFQISLVWSWQPIELKSGDIPAPTLGVPHCAHPLWDKSALYTMLHLRNHTVYLPSVCPSHPLWDNRREGAGTPSKIYYTLKFHSLPLLNVHKPLNLLHLICFCPHRENEVQYVIANVDKDIRTHRQILHIIW